VIVLQELRRVDISANVLDDDVRRVAITADGDVAVGKFEALAAVS